MTQTTDYDYELPKELIAQFPLQCRTDARLLVVDRTRQTISHSHIRDLPEWLQATDSIVLNDTQVIPARLTGYRQRTRGRWQGLFLSAAEPGVWRILGKTRGRLQPGETVMLHDREGRDALRLSMLANLGGGEWAARPDSNEPTLSVLDRVGRVPLPGYIRSGEMSDADLASYQTVFATRPGAVAAPTAGLHFTDSLLQRIEQAGTAVCRVTLHVGLGTFRPLSTVTLEEHRMHSEWCSIDAATVEQLLARRKAGGRVVAIGTTAVRTLESSATSGILRPWQGETDLFIRPPFQFRAANALLTNFHLPKSTLLVLVRTFGGDDLIKRAYDEAIRERYRFYSYGDAMLIV